MKQKIISKEVLLNSAIAGGLVFFGAFSGGDISSTSIVAAVSAAFLVFLTKIKEHLKTKNKKQFTLNFF